MLVVAAHPDDETLGCGGTIARHVAEGDTVDAVFMADGVSSRPGADPDEAASRLLCSEQALSILGIKRSFHLGMPDNMLDSIPLLELVQRLEKIVAETAPDLIYTHHCADLNIDHRITFQAVLTVARPQPRCSIREVLTFEVMSSTEWASESGTPFAPDVFTDITAYWEQKKKALAAYAVEMREAPHSRSVAHMDALSLHRGMSVGLARAEAFKLIRRIA